jgi:hypothetical protein
LPAKPVSNFHDGQGTTVIVVFMEVPVLFWGAATVIQGVLKTPWTAAMLLSGYEYDDVELKWVDPAEGNVVGGWSYVLEREVRRGSFF